MGRKLLVREAKRAALARMEDAARTEKDFRAVVEQWNHLDKNRERRVRYNEVKRPNEMMLHWDKINENDEKGRMKDGLETVIPAPLEHEWWRQQLRGDFIDTFFDCPHELHELVSDRLFSQALQDLSENHKEILYYSAIRQWNNVRIAAKREQTDRNIRKTLVLLLKRLRENLIFRIEETLGMRLPITPLQQKFLERYEKIALDKPKDG